MNPIARLLESAGTWLAQSQIQKTEGKLREVEQHRQQAIDSYHLLRESLVDLAQDLRSDGAWRRVGGGSGTEFDQQALQDIMDDARSYYLKNPLIRRGVDLTAAYVFGQGVTIQHEDEEVNAVIQTFWDDPGNRKAFTAQTRLVANQRYLHSMGNFYLSHFTDPSTGAVKVRMMPAPEVKEIISNPDDAAQPWYYLRRWNAASKPGAVAQERKAYYPALFYEPSGDERLAAIGPERIPVAWDAPILHVAIGNLADMQFGVSGTYPAHDWVRTDLKFLSDCASFFSSLARWAYKLTGLSGQRGLDTAKAKLASTFGVNASTDGGRETNPAPTAGAAFLGIGDVKLEPLKIGGIGPDPLQGRVFRQYVATVFGFSETFFGNADVSNLATSKTLDRPFELVIMVYQQLWREQIETICRYVIEKAASSPSGPLRGRLIADRPGEGIELKANAATGNQITTTVKVTFPPVLEHDITETIKAIVAAVTLDGKQPAQWATGTEGVLLVTRLLLAALGESNPDEIKEKLFPGGVVPEPPEPEPAAVAKAVEGLSRQIREAATTRA